MMLWLLRLSKARQLPRQAKLKISFLLPSRASLERRWVDLKVCSKANVAREMTGCDKELVLARTANS